MPSSRSSAGARTCRPSADVVASFNRYMRVGNDRGMFSIVEKYEAPDANTFVMRLKRPQPTFLENLSSFSVPVVIHPAEFEAAPRNGP